MIFEEVFKDNPTLWVICEACGRLARRVNPGDGIGTCKHCKASTKKLHLVSIEDLTREVIKVERTTT